MGHLFLYQPGLPPKRGIEHQVDLVPGVPLPNRPPYQTNPEEMKEIQRQVEDLLNKGFYHRFMKDFSTLAALVNGLPKKGTPLKWGDAQDKSFQELERRLTSTPLLLLPDFSKTFEIRNIKYLHPNIPHNQQDWISELCESVKCEVEVFHHNIIEMSEPQHNIPPQPRERISELCKSTKSELEVFPPNIKEMSDPPDKREMIIQLLNIHKVLSLKYV